MMRRGQIAALALVLLGGVSAVPAANITIDGRTLPLTPIREGSWQNAPHAYWGTRQSKCVFHLPPDPGTPKPFGVPPLRHPVLVIVGPSWTTTIPMGETAPGVYEPSDGSGRAVVRAP